MVSPRRSVNGIPSTPSTRTLVGEPMKKARFLFRSIVDLMLYSAGEGRVSNLSGIFMEYYLFSRKRSPFPKVFYSQLSKLRITVIGARNLSV